MFKDYFKIRNPNIESRNKFEYQMLEIQNRLEHLNLCFLKIVSDFDQFYKIRRASGFDEKWLSIYNFPYSKF